MLLGFILGRVLFSISNSDLRHGHIKFAGGIKLGTNHYRNEQRDLGRPEKLGNTNPSILKKGKCKPTLGKEQPLVATQVEQ